MKPKPVSDANFINVKEKVISQEKRQEIMIELRQIL